MAQYRKLPGCRRGFFSIASLWIGDDHLLSVKSDRFHEYYRRFYFRDIQAIAVTRSPRFHVSTRALTVGALLAATLLFARDSAPWLTPWLWLLLGGLVAGWIKVSAAHSCICRIYTAVSCEELPSVYRTWTARKVLAELEARITQAQGALSVGWAEAIEERPAGPRAALNEPALEALAARGPLERSRTWVSDAFLVSLFAYAIASSLDLHSPRPFTRWLLQGLALIQVVGAIWVFVQRHRRILRSSMQGVAIAALILSGFSVYAQFFAMRFLSVRDHIEILPDQMYDQPMYIVIRQVYMAGCLALGAVGLVLSFGSGSAKRPPPLPSRPE